MRLWILVEVLHIGMGWSTVEIKVVVLHVFAMIAFTGRQAKSAFFQNRIFSIPEDNTENQKLIAITDRCEPIFAPAVGLASGRVMRKKIPCRSVRAVVLANRSPRTFADIRPPTTPQKF